MTLSRVNSSHLPLQSEKKKVHVCVCVCVHRMQGTAVGRFLNTLTKRAFFSYKSRAEAITIN